MFAHRESLKVQFIRHVFSKTPGYIPDIMPSVFLVGVHLEAGKLASNSLISLISRRVSVIFTD